MTSERIFNIFVFFEDGISREYGIRHHRISGTDDISSDRSTDILRRSLSSFVGLVRLSGAVISLGGRAGL